MCLTPRVFTVLSLGLLIAGCDSAQKIEGDVGINPSKAQQVGSVTVTETANKQYFIVSWGAVAGDAAYNVFFKQEGKLSSVPAITYAQNTYKYDAAAGDAGANDDVDKWSVRISSSSIAAAGSYRFGVRTSLNSGGAASAPSDIKWSDPVTVAGGAQVSAVTATATTDKEYIIVSWGAVAEDAQYSLLLKQEGKLSSVSVSAYPQNSYKYDTATGDESVNTDLDKWSALISNSNLNDSPAGTYRFGVCTSPSTSASPDIKWSNTFTVTPGPQVSAVTVTKTTDKRYYIVSWDAVGTFKEEDVDYILYFKQEGKPKSRIWLTTQHTAKYAAADGALSTNDDPKKWSVRIDSSSAPTTAGDSHYGVLTLLTNGGVTSAPSEEKWSDTFAVTKGPQVSAVTVKTTTDGQYIIVSWDAVAGADSYSVETERNGYPWDSSSGQNAFTYDEADGSGSPITDTKKWSYLASVYSSGSTYRFSVKPATADIGVIPGDEKWSDPVTVP